MDLYTSNTMYHIGVTTASAVYFGKIADGQKLTQMDSITMLVVNVLVAFSSTVILLWAIYILLSGDESKYDTMKHLSKRHSSHGHSTKHNK